MAELNLAETLQLVADTIVESLGFDAAVINLIDDDSKSMVVAAVCGPADLRAKLLHRRQGLKGWAHLLEASEPWGRLRFLDHAKSTTDPSDIMSWIPDMPISDDPNAWHPEDALFAPLEGPNGRQLGMLSVDVPRDGLRPNASTRHALEALAVTASLAIQHATLAAESRRAGARFQAVFDASPIPIGLLAGDRRFVNVNDAYCHFLGRPRENLVGHDPLEFTHPDDIQATTALSAVVRAHIEDESQVGPVEKRYLLPDGSVVWARLHLAALHTKDEPDLVIAQLEDITDRKRAEARLVQQAHYDTLTGLPNRAHSMRRLRAVLEGDAETGTLTAVFFCDVDRLKLVNDAHGHAVGDAYLREVARRIRANVRSDDIVGRLSGDEFVVVLPGIGSPTQAIGLAGRVIDAVRQPLRLGGEGFSPSVSLGIAYSVGAGSTPDELLAQADTAMYRAKSEDRGSWRVHDSAVKTSAVSQLQLRTDVAAALDLEQFVLHYQPIVRLADHKVIGYEALLRWQHPTRGLLAPAAFLDVVLDSEYETPVTDWVLRRACRDASRRPPDQRRVNVNVSSVQVGRRDLPDLVLACLSETGLEAGDLVLELTEDRLLSRPDGAQLLDRLRNLGVSIAIDDFGTGYAGLQYLQRFPDINIIKLDGGFIAGLWQDQVSEHIVRGIIDIAHSCGLTLVVEGVETIEQAHFVQQLGADAAQGYYFGRPAPMPAVEG
jgi:diguanylate cyclase (GGDEF)-like protein/PAS domain S-box-containing protein